MYTRLIRTLLLACACAGLAAACTAEPPTAPTDDQLSPLQQMIGAGGRSDTTATGPG